MESKKSVAGTSPRDQLRMIQLKPPGQIIFAANDLPQTRRRWKGEMVLYIDLARSGQQEITKVKFILYVYIVGS